MSVDIDGHQPINSEYLKVKDNWQNENLRALLEFNQCCYPLIYCVELTELFQRYVVYKTQLQTLDTDQLN